MEGTGYRGVEELEVWKKTRILKNEIFEEVKKIPPEEKYRLVDQLSRSSRSINGQIAQGHGRKTYPDRSRFCVQARGSLAETLNHLIDAYDSRYITGERLSYYREKIDEIEKMLNGYIKWLDQKSKA